MKRPYARRRWCKALRKLADGATVPEVCRSMKLDPSGVYRRLRKLRHAVGGPATD
jgi:hypothetical protein